MIFVATELSNQVINWFSRKLSMDVLLLKQTVKRLRAEAMRFSLEQIKQMLHS